MGGHGLLHAYCVAQIREAPISVKAKGLENGGNRLDIPGICDYGATPCKAATGPSPFPIADQSPVFAGGGVAGLIRFSTFFFSAALFALVALLTLSARLAALACSSIISI